MGEGRRERLQYTVNVETSWNLYDRLPRCFQGAGGTFHLERRWRDVTGAHASSVTGAHQTFTTLTKTGVNLTAGTHELRLVIDSNNATSGLAGNFNWMRLTQTGSTPTNRCTGGRNHQPGEHPGFQRSARTTSSSSPTRSGPRWHDRQGRVLRRWVLRRRGYIGRAFTHDR